MRRDAEQVPASCVNPLQIQPECGGILLGKMNDLIVRLNPAAEACFSEESRTTADNDLIDNENSPGLPTTTVMVLLYWDLLSKINTY